MDQREAYLALNRARGPKKNSKNILACHCGKWIREEDHVVTN